MKFKTKIKLQLQKRYFDIGFNFLTYLKYPLILLGIAIPDVKYIIIISFCYALFCYIIGWLYVKYGWYKAEIEVSNLFNLFVWEMRKKIGTPKNRKL